MAERNVIQLFPEPTAAANTNISAVAAELATAAATATAAPLSGAAVTGGAVASLWAPAALPCAVVEQQATHVDAAVGLRGGKIARANTQALTDTMATDDQNRRDLTAHPVVSI